MPRSRQNFIRKHSDLFWYTPEQAKRNIGGNLRILDGIVYFDVNSANYKWYGQVCKKYPADYVAKYKLANMVIAWEDPLNAVVTMGSGGEMEIAGMQSRFMYGISPADAGFPVEFGGRAVTPIIQSASFCMKY